MLRVTGYRLDSYEFRFAGWTEKIYFQILNVERGLPFRAQGAGGTYFN